MAPLDTSDSADISSAALPGTGRAQRRVRRVIRPVLNSFWKVTLEGLDNIPAEGPAILCPNHISFFDSVFTMVYAGRQISFRVHGFVEDKTLVPCIRNDSD